MTSKNLFFKLMREDLKRRVWAVCLAFLCFFFWIPVVTAMGISRINEQVQDWINMGRIFQNTTLELERYSDLLGLAGNALGMQNIMLPFIVGTAAIVLGLTGFSWLHSKSKVDFYHSAPIKRELLFSVKYLNGILMVFSMYFLNLLIACGIMAANGVGFGTVFVPALISMLVHLVNFVMIYTVVLTAVMMTGNFFISILGMIVFFVYMPCFAALMDGLASMFFMTYNWADSSFWTDLMLHGSPIAYYGRMMGIGMDLDLAKYGQLLPKLGFPLLVAAGLLFFCLILYRLRPSEACGKAMAFKLTMAPIKIAIVVPFAIFFSLFFWGIYQSMGWAVFGFLFGLVVTHCIMEVIYHFDFRKLFAHLPQMAVCGVLALAVIGVYRYDLTGYDRFFPSESRFSSASVYCTAMDDWSNTGLPVKTGENYHWKNTSVSGYMSENMEITDRDLINELARAGIENAKAEKGIRFSKEEAYVNSGESLTGEDKPYVYDSGVTVRYRLKNGKSKVRTYNMDLVAMQDAFGRLYLSEEYKKGAYPIMNRAAKDLTGIYYVKNYRLYEVKNTDAAQREELLKTYQEELAALSLDDRKVETPVALLRFLSTAEHEYLVYLTRKNHPEYEGDFRMEDMDEINLVPIYPSFTKTIALLKQAGADVTAMPELSDVDRVQILSDYSENAHEGYSEEYVDTEDLRYDIGVAEQERRGATGFTVYNDSADGAAKIRKLLGTLDDLDCVSANNLQRYDNNITVRVYLKSVNEDLEADQQSSNVYLFKDGKMPDFVKEGIGYDQIAKKDLHLGLCGPLD